MNSPSLSQRTASISESMHAGGMPPCTNVSRISGFCLRAILLGGQVLAWSLHLFPDIFRNRKSPTHVVWPIGAQGGAVQGRRAERGIKYTQGHSSPSSGFVVEACRFQGSCVLRYSTVLEFSVQVYTPALGVKIRNLV